MPENNEIILDEENDLDDLVGGATIVTKIDKNILQTFGAQKCNCGLFVSKNKPLSLDICDNCKWSLASELNSKTTFCSVQER